MLYLKNGSQTKVAKTFCTTREASELLGISVGTAQLWVESGLLSAWKTPGGHRRVTRESVEKLLHAKPVQAFATTAPSVDAPSRLKVLVIEDDAFLLRLYKKMLSAWPMAPEVALANNGVDGLLLIERLKPDLMVIDLNIPSIFDGFTTLKILKDNPRFAAMTMVVVSGLDHAEIQQRGGVPTGIEVLPKPVPFGRLLAIAMQIEKRQNPSVPGAASTAS